MESHRSGEVRGLLVLVAIKRTDCPSDSVHIAWSTDGEEH